MNDELDPSDPFFEGDLFYANQKKMFQAIRAFRKLFSINTEGWDRLEAADAEFDGGEWSSSSWGDAWFDEQDRVANIIAKSFGVDVDDLAEELFRYEMGAYDPRPLTLRMH